MSCSAAVTSASNGSGAFSISHALQQGRTVMGRARMTY